ncbi:Protein of unknown function DUF4817 [Trinorchestia longiramus]|nr:Protein of unknown function DUF4817 [Trinorchestia longiramus]
MQLTKEQRTFIVEKYFQAKSFQQVIQSFQEHFPERQSPTKMTIWRNVTRYRTEGTSLNLNKGRSGRKKPGRSEENVRIVQVALTENPQIFARKSRLDVTKSTFNRIRTLDLKGHPYKMHVRNKLLDNDLPQRLNFAQWFLQRNVRFVDDIVVLDEAAFHLNGKVNNHNVRTHAPKNQPPNFNFNVGISREKVSVWIGLCGNGHVIGPYFYNNNLNGGKYLDLTNNRIVPRLQETLGNRINRTWWIQDGAPAHRTVAVREKLNELFGNRIITLNHRIEWPPRSPDLTSCDFFLWGHLESKVYSSPLRNTDELKQKIENEANLLQGDDALVRRVMVGMRRRMQQCIEETEDTPKETNNRRNISIVFYFSGSFHLING